MEKVKKIIAFVAICVWVLGIGSTAYLFYYNEPLFAVVNLLLLAEALPFASDAFKYLLE